MQKLIIGLVASVFIIVSVGIYAYYQYTTTPSCTQQVRAPWFSIAIELDETTLPQGIQEVRLSGKDASYGLQNTTEIPLYLVTEYTQGEDQYALDYPHSELPTMYLPLYKLTDTTTYIYTNTWKETTNDPSNPLNHVVQTTPYLLERMGNTFKNQYSDDRPDNASIPVSHPIAITGYFANQPVTIQGMAHYALNTEYEATIATKKQLTCQRRFVVFEISDHILTALLYGLPLVIIDLAYLLYRSIKRKEPETILYILPILYVLTVLVFVSTAVYFT